MTLGRQIPSSTQFQICPNVYGWLIPRDLRSVYALARCLVCELTLSFCIGSALIGVWLQLILYGAACAQVCAIHHLTPTRSRAHISRTCQVYFYYTEYTDDALWLRSLVGFLWCVYLASTSFCFVAEWQRGRTLGTMNIVFGGYTPASRSILELMMFDQSMSF